jgi:hypothetical protein
MSTINNQMCQIPREYSLVCAVTERSSFIYFIIKIDHFLHNLITLLQLFRLYNKE